MKIPKDDIATLNQLKYGYNPDIELRPGSQWLEVEGILGIAGTTLKAFLFNHELGQAWVPKSAVKFELKIGCDPVEPDYRVYIASWFNWTEKIELMKQGKIYSDEYLRKRQKETEARFSSPPPIIEEIDKLAKGKPSAFTPPPGSNWDGSKGIDFKKRNKRQKERNKLRSDLLVDIQAKEYEFNKIAKVFRKQQRANKIKSITRLETMKSAIKLWNALGAYTEAGFDFSDDQADMYEQLDDLIERLKAKSKEIDKMKSNQNRAIDL